MPDRRLSVQGCTQNLAAILLALRDPARATSQLYLRVAWTSAFKQFSFQNLGYPMAWPMDGSMGHLVDHHFLDFFFSLNKMH